MRMQKKGRGFISAALVTLIASASPAHAASDPAIYGLVPAEKSLETSSQFILVDDFNTGKFLIREGAGWRVKGPLGALEIMIDKTDARNPERGYSLKNDFSLASSEKASFETSLDHMDVSKATHLVFKIKLAMKDKAAFPGKLAVTLMDWNQKQAEVDLSPRVAAADGSWIEVELPIGDFSGLDPDQLTRLKFTLTAPDSKKMHGALWLDEIAFFGPGNAEFLSHRDNIVSFPSGMSSERRHKLAKQKKDAKFLKMIAEDTWKFFENARDKNTHLIVDHIRLGDAPLIADYTSPTNIAMDLLSTIAAMDLEILSREQAADSVGKVLKTLDRLPKYKGFFYNFYDIAKLSIQRSYISTVDSGWLAIALVVVRQAFPEYKEQASKFLDGFHFGDFLDPENNQLVVGLDVPMKDFGKYHYGLLVTEARATSLYAIGKGDLPREHWWFIYRTLPQVWGWQKQKPAGDFITEDGVEYFQGYYQQDGKKFVPSWGGSLFEFLMPTLVLKERKLAPQGLGLNDKIATELQRDYALKKGYPVWGMSPCAVSNGRQWTYREYGVPGLGAKGYPDAGVVTPHVSFLALDSLPQDALKNIRNLLKFDIYGEYGFYDAIDLKKGRVNPQYLSLDQGMILVAIANYLKEGTIQNRFHADPVGKKAEDLLSKESFFKT
ncbi:MAG TPA: glucoamylase family protein [Verrucomicrobiae bacterium]|jgi:hypothetical protein|nr:glucoamylase family protein [Verrucomicrobiae bacterium]